VVSPSFVDSVTLPAHFDDRLPKRHVSYVMRTSVVLPPTFKGRVVSLSIPFFRGRATLRANGVDVPERTASPLERVFARGPHLYVIPRGLTLGPGLDLELTVDHVFSMSGWWDTVPSLTVGEEGSASFVRISQFDYAAWAAGIAVASFAAFIYGVLYLLNRRRPAHGWFAVQSAGMLPMLLMYGGLSQYVLGELDLFPWVAIPNVLSMLGAGTFLAAITACACLRGPSACRSWSSLPLPESPCAIRSASRSGIESGSPWRWSRCFRRCSGCERSSYAARVR
jgi:hypothetical protein